MRDAYIDSLNSQKTMSQWMGDIAENLNNLYTPGYREKQNTFRTCLASVVADKPLKSFAQGKALPSNSPENVFLEGNGYFVLRNEDGKVAYTRFGNFKFDGEGVYKAADGSKVQGYILNDKGEIMSGTKSLSNEAFEETIAQGGALSIPTTEIKLWIDPDNGKFLGKYDEFEIKDGGILYGKSNNGKDCTPLYKLALMNFHNPQELFEYKQGQFLETAYSGKPVIGKGEVKSGSLEMSNVDGNIASINYQQMQIQHEASRSIMKQYSKLLESIMGLMNN